MASIKNLKKEINYKLSDIIEECYVWQMLQEDQKKADKAEKIIDECITTFDGLILKVNDSKVENHKKHFEGIRAELDKNTASLMAKIQKL